MEWKGKEEEEKERIVYFICTGVGVGVGVGQSALPLPLPSPHLRSAALLRVWAPHAFPFHSFSLSPFSSSSISSNKNDKISSIYYCVLYLPLYSTWYVYIGRYRGTDTARACVGSILHSNITRTCMLNNIVPVNT